MSDPATLAKFSTLIRNRMGLEVISAPVVDEEIVNNEDGSTFLRFRRWEPWEIVVLTLGCIAFVLICVGLGYYIYRRRKQASASPVIQRVQA